MWGRIPGIQDYDLGWRQMLHRLSHPGAHLGLVLTLGVSAGKSEHKPSARRGINEGTIRRGVGRNGETSWGSQHWGGIVPGDLKGKGRKLC